MGQMTEVRVAPARRLLCLDIDGTVRQSVDDELGRFVNCAADVKVWPEAVEMMRRWRGGRIIGVSNQGGIALGHVSLADVDAAMQETMRQCDGLFYSVAFCPHHPAAPDPGQWAVCWCRKPRPGMIISQATLMARDLGESYPPALGLMVGDRPEDEECAAAAGLPFMPADQWRAGAAVPQ